MVGDDDDVAGYFVALDDELRRGRMEMNRFVAHLGIHGNARIAFPAPVHQNSKRSLDVQCPA